MTSKGAVILNRLQQNGIYPDRVIQKKDKSFEVRFGFFYTHGRTAEKYRDQILLVYPEAKILEIHEIWNSWPKDSYFSVRFKL
jgi:hypothetical protein